jgi:hypothetical protein
MNETQRLLGQYTDFLGAVASVAEGGSPSRRAIPEGIDPPLRASIIHALVDGFLKLPFDVVVPGTHRPRLKDGRRARGTMSNQRLFAVLDAGGRPFLRVNRIMLLRGRLDLLEQFEGATLLPLLLDFEMAMTDSVKGTIRGRMLGTVTDVRLRSNSYRWAMYKRRKGYNSRPGMMTGPNDGSLYAATDRVRLAYRRRR